MPLRPSLAEPVEQAGQRLLARALVARLLCRDVLAERGRLATVKDTEIERAIAIGEVQPLDGIGDVVVARQPGDALLVALERIDLVESWAGAVDVDEREALVVDALDDEVGQFLRLGG